MKNLIIVATLIFQANYASAEVKYLDDVIQQASPSQTQDLSKLLNDIKLSPTTDPKTGNSIYSVTKVVAGSIYEKAGIKVGDLVAMGNAPKKKYQKLEFKKGQVIKTVNGETVESPAHAMELYNQMEATGAATGQVVTEPAN